MSEAQPVVERRVAVVFLVDRRGRILMQQRTADAAVSPNQWTMPGGKIEAGEQPLEAAHRELYEETGLRTDVLEPFWFGTRPSVSNPEHGVVEVYAYVGTTDAGQDDVVLGEGQAMIFLDPEEALAKDLGATAVRLLPRFLASLEYAGLRARSGTQ
ncbi:MAG TPA: NUDIX hydrolase [Micromonosporaceae bacterium]|nr:NUDIX hydrolase [Micromonosporaceae bacterium]